NRVPPPTSDRCTVFMEKDIDLLIAKGVPKEDIAGAVLFAVRDNYLNKVVGNVPIGDKVYFQGATARNRALVSAFEERLDRKIIVSPYCHLTGAMGSALYVMDRKPAKSRFIGLEFSNKDTVIEKETCDLCVNKCALSIISTDDIKVAWGLKCGRDYDSKKPRANTANPYLKERENFINKKKTIYKRGKIYIPDFLANSENIYFLKSFFDYLDIEPVILSPSKDDYERGRKIAHFEICAPCVITFGAMSKLKDEKIFFPYFLKNEVPENITECHLCPLTQTIPSILKTQKKDISFITPKILKISKDKKYLDSLFEELSKHFEITYKEISSAFNYAEKTVEMEMEKKYSQGEEFLKNLKDDEIGVVFLGRPYILYNPRFNHRLIDKIADYKIKSITVDFITPDINFITDKFSHVYWQYGQIILSTLKLFKEKRNLFPVFLSCFSCGPDSFILNYFYREMESLKKPYLVLQLDGHSSATGYITRLEAGIDSFRNYLKLDISGDFTKDSYSKIEDIPDRDRTVLIPPMEEDGAELIAGAFTRRYKSAETLKESLDSFREGLKYSTGYECSPFHSTLGAVLKRTNNGGGKYAYFMPTGIGPCRFGQYSLFQRIVLRSLGRDVSLISPSDRNAYAGLSDDLKKTIFDSIIINDILKKIVLTIRPYEIEKGETNHTLQNVYRNIKKAIESKENYIKVYKESVKNLANIRIKKVNKPLIGIVGEIYVRSNSFLNDNLIKTIEALGAEAKIATISEWFFYTLFLEGLDIKLKKSGWESRLKHLLRKFFYFSREHKLFNYAKEYFPDIFEPNIYDVVEKGSNYLPEEFLGEAILTIGRAIIFFEEEKVDAIVNASPTFCMPGTISSYILKDIEKKYKKPVIPLFYDKSGKPNLDLIPYIEILKNSAIRAS
ncbi:MAG: acyl-CoA dehydratase activase-related protein, partial [Proteobacteria bacterium]|nr:acyl-CoA dehydratase activase-related protein [Pseudomonadota bacterium]